MKAAETKYHCPTLHKGARISVQWGDRRTYIPYPSELDGEAAHRKALSQALKVKNSEYQVEQFITGGLGTGGDRYAHVLNIPSRN